MKTMPVSIRVPSLFWCAFIVSIFSMANAVSAQSRQVNQNLPRIGTIKDYPATGLMTGCANLYFYPVPKRELAGDDFIFLARGDGSNGWMNLNGRDVRLHQVKSRTRSDADAHQYGYRVGRLQITVIFEKIKPESAAASDDDFMMKMKIVLRRGRAVRIARAVGESDC